MSTRSTLPDTQLEPVHWSDLDGWAADDHAAAFATFRISCKPFLRQQHRPRDSAADLRGAVGGVPARGCRRRPVQPTRTRPGHFFEDNFRPVRIAKLGERTGLLTGYYEPIVDGSRFPSPEFSVPLYRRPRDLVVGGPEDRQAPSFPNRATVGRLNDKKQIEPYYDRGAIEDGALDGQHLEICWMRDAWDVMSIQIQGSARVRLEDGTLLRVNYDAHNGFRYTAVGRDPDRAQSGPARRNVDGPHPPLDGRQSGPGQGGARDQPLLRVLPHHRTVRRRARRVGAQGVPLTPGRSIAVDKIHVYGTPFFIEADLPIESERPTTQVPPPDGGAGHRLRDRRAGARRPLLGRRRRGRPYRGPHPPPGPVHDAVAARTRHG